jgi:hypothetical protein
MEEQPLQAMRRPSSPNSYSRARDSVCWTICDGVDWRTYTCASRQRCEALTLSVVSNNAGADTPDGTSRIAHLASRAGGRAAVPRCVRGARLAGLRLRPRRRTWTSRPAILRSIPLIAATQVPIIIGSGWLVGALAVVTVAVTCLRCPNLRAGWRHDLATGHRLRTHRDVAGRGTHLPGPIPAGHPADLARGADDGLRVR